MAGFMVLSQKAATRRGVPRLFLCVKMCFVYYGAGDMVMKGLTHALMGFPGPSSIPHTVRYTYAEVAQKIKAEWECGA